MFSFFKSKPKRPPITNDAPNVATPPPSPPAPAAEVPEVVVVAAAAAAAASRQPHELAAETAALVAPMLLRAEAAAARAEVAAARTDAVSRGGSLQLLAQSFPPTSSSLQPAPPAAARLPQPPPAPTGPAGDSHVYIEELLPPQGASRALHGSLPSGSHATTISQSELLVHKVATCCGLPVPMGAGYEATLLPLSMLSRYQLRSASACGLAGCSCSCIQITTLPQGQHTLHACLGPKDQAEFLAHMARHAAPSRWAPLPGSTPAPTPSPTFTLAAHCCASSSTRTLTLRQDGMLELREQQQLGGATTLLTLQAAHALDFSHLRAVSSGWGAQLCLGAPGTQLEVSFLGGSYVLVQPFADSRALAEGAAAVLRAVLQRQPAAPEVVLQGLEGSSLALGADFIVSTTAAPSCHPLLASTHTLAVRTRDISHLTAALPSLQSALLGGQKGGLLPPQREAARRWHSLCSQGPALCLSGWPLACLQDAWALTALHLGMLLWGVGACLGGGLLGVWFGGGRRTALVLGGPGPGLQVVFHPSEQPEGLLRSVAARIAGLQEQAILGPPAAALAGHSQSGADKLGGSGGEEGLRA